MVKNLDDDQLDKLEAIMGKDIDEVTEFEMIMAELKEMGMEDEDIADLKQLAQLMHEFLSQVPDLASKLELESDYDLLDNIQVKFFSWLYFLDYWIIFSSTYSDFLTSWDPLDTLPSTTYLRMRERMVRL